MILPTFLAGLLLATSGTGAEPVSPPGQLDFLAGDWAITDSAGRHGHSHIVVQLPGAMLYEVREIAQDGPLPLWFALSERTHGWVQLFPGPAGIREFALVSAAGTWPMVFGADVTLRDGSRVRFRLTMTRASADESRRLLELSRDAGASWAPVFDYAYRRSPAVAGPGQGR